MADCLVVDSDEEPVHKHVQPSRDDLRRIIFEAMMACDLTKMSVKALRVDAEAKLGLPQGFLHERKGDIRTLAQELLPEVQASAALPPARVATMATPQNAVPAVPPPVCEPHKRKAHSACDDPPGGTIVAAEGGASAAPLAPAKKRSRPVATSPPPPTPPPGSATGAVAASPKAPPPPQAEVPAPPQASVALPKPKRPLSAYFLWLHDVRPSLTEELGTNNFGEVARAASQRWKVLDANEKRAYEEKAAALKAEGAVAAAAMAAAAGTSNMPSTAAALPPASEKGGRGKGRPKKDNGARAKSSTISGGLTRADFQQLATPIRFSLEEPELLQAPVRLSLTPRTFASGSVGWFSCTKVPVTIGGRQISVQVQINFTAIGSKNWLNGEGYVAGPPPVVATAAAVAAGTSGADAAGEPNAADEEERVEDDTRGEEEAEAYTAVEPKEGDEEAQVAKEAQESQRKADTPREDDSTGSVAVSREEPPCHHADPPVEAAVPATGEIDCAEGEAGASSAAAPRDADGADF